MMPKEVRELDRVSLAPRATEMKPPMSNVPILTITHTIQPKNEQIYVYDKNIEDYVLDQTRC